VAALSPAAVLKQIAAGTPDPIYLLQGDDEVEKSALAAEFSELVEAGLRAFNVERIHAGDLTTGDRLADGVASIAAAVAPHHAEICSKPRSAKPAPPG